MVGQRHEDVVVDIHDPSSPVIVGNNDAPVAANAVEISDNYAFVADGQAGFKVIDISDPSSPVLVGSLDTPGLALGVKVTGGYAYLADHESGLLIIDIHDPIAVHASVPSG